MVANDNIVDGLNRGKKRTAMNTSLWSFNCGGFALNTYSWYMPVVNREEGSMLFGFLSMLPTEIALRITVKCMLREFEDLRVIENLDEVKRYEYPIAYKIGNGDFHYAKRVGGQWFHKRGANPRIEKMSEKEIFAETWCDEMYDSKLILFAKRKG